MPSTGSNHNLFATAEGRRIRYPETAKLWRFWGPYMSERQWGTVREDYSAEGGAWDYFPFDHAHRRAYRWGEDGIGGFGDHHLRWCLGVALWNERDAILKERLFGLTNSQGNHGEDVKEAYYYCDAAPSHAYLRMLYKYPQRAFPYERLIRENRERGFAEPEFELWDCDAFGGERYFDVAIEYAKAAPDDILMRLTVENRGPDVAPIHVLPQLWARNIWSWAPGKARPLLKAGEDGSVAATHPTLRPMRFWAETDGAPRWLFTENETNTPRLFGGEAPGPFKDGFNDYVVEGRLDAVSAKGEGTKCAHYVRLSLAPGEAGVARLRFRPAEETAPPFENFDAVFANRRAELDDFYAALQAGIADADARAVQRQALAGMIWSKQFYNFDVRRWLAGDPLQPSPPAARRGGRNREWTHLHNADIISMPDKWEYPWYAAWDLALQCVTLALVDPDFAKSQLTLLTSERYMHVNGQLPAYEWGFEDVNPPVHAWATMRVYDMDRKLRGAADRAFLETVFHKLLLNFNWWVNRKDAQGRNIFQGGFLGLDNIGLFDRSKPLPTGGFINQSDGTAWMAMYSLNLMSIALELARDNSVYEGLATKFFEHFLYIAEAMTRMGGEVGLWDEEDQFYYDVLNLPGDRSIPLKVRSMVGLIPLFAVEVFDEETFRRFPQFTARLQWLLNYRPDLAGLVSRWAEPSHGSEMRLLSLLRGSRMKRLLRRALDEREFLSDYGVRSLSKVYASEPYRFHHDGTGFSVGYEPGVSASGLFGGNSNWRGPVWMPMNYLLIESLRKFHVYYGDEFLVECPTGSGRKLTLRQIAAELAERVSRLFLVDSRGRRPVHGDVGRVQRDPAFRDHLLFYEFFDGDSGAGLGASHQTGWTGLVANLLMDGFD